MADRGARIKSSRRDEAAGGAHRLTITLIHENGILLRRLYGAALGQNDNLAVGLI